MSKVLINSELLEDLREAANELHFRSQYVKRTANWFDELVKMADAALAAQTVVYQCPRCGTGMEVDHEAKPAPQQAASKHVDDIDVADLKTEIQAARIAGLRMALEIWESGGPAAHYRMQLEEAIEREKAK